MASHFGPQLGFPAWKLVLLAFPILPRDLRRRWQALHKACVLGSVYRLHPSLFIAADGSLCHTDLSRWYEPGSKPALMAAAADILDSVDYLEAGEEDLSELREDLTEDVARTHFGADDREAEGA